jgi:hypothetical protein
MESPATSMYLAGLIRVRQRCVARWMLSKYLVYTFHERQGHAGEYKGKLVTSLEDPKIPSAKRSSTIGR